MDGTNHLQMLFMLTIDKIATFAAKNKAVIIVGTEAYHFENEVFSWHKINNERGDDILPSLLITNAHPSYFNDDG